MASSVPRVAAEWMVSHLPGRQGQDWIVEHLETTGLGILTVKELKTLGDILYSMVAVIEEVSIGERRLPSSAKKQRRVDFLRRGLFRDDPCTLVNDRLLQDMRSEGRTPSPPARATGCQKPTGASAPAARAPNSSPVAPTSIGSRKRPNHQVSIQSQQQQRQPNRFSAVDANAIFNAYMSQFHPPGSIGAHHHPFAQYGQNPWGSVPMPASLHYSEPSSTARNGPYNFSGGAHNEEERQVGNHSQAVVVAGSTGVGPADADSNPRDPTEAILLQQLLQMGFQKQEILDGIRQHRSNTVEVPSADEIMLKLISQREEFEEARREDAVRLQSEGQKQEESRRREQNQQESIADATTGKDLSAIFPDSWVLSAITTDTADSDGNHQSVATILSSESRADFVEFLKLEEKSRKWYGWVLPKEYFQKVGTGLKGIGETEPIPQWATTLLQSEREKLRRGLYELKEQVNGQPKIFLDERPVQNGSKTEIVEIDDDDD